MRTFTCALIILLWGICGCQSSTSTDEATYQFVPFVDPFIGTGGHGHTYPGATAPFGMLQLSPDTRLSGWDGCSGYHYTDSVIFGFSHTHLSGTGVSDYGDLLLMPYCSPRKNTLSYTQFAASFDKKKEKAAAGLYEVYLNEPAIAVALTATDRGGLHRYRFEQDSQQYLLIDLQHRDQLLASDLEIVDNQTIRGLRRSSAWATDQHFYFYMQFSKPFVEPQIVENDSSRKVQALLHFDNNNQELLVKVGISAVSMEGAQKNLEAEITDWDFEKVVRQTQQKWENELSKIEVEGNTEEQKTIFYTALYHSFLAPNIFMDVDGHYRGTDGQVHQAEGYTHHTVFSLWDTYRGTHPLFTILQRKRTLDFIKTFLAQYQEGGQLPVWELAGNYTGCMIGYHSTSVIADAYTKGITNFDTLLALQAMQHSANADHLGLDYYKQKGYITCTEEAESVSKTLEYAYDDWCIAQFAKALGKDSIFRHYQKRAQAYKHLYDPSSQFIRGRMHGGWLSPFDPKEVNFNYTEANAWQYNFSVPQDIQGYVQLMGGEEAFEKQLNQLFETPSQLEGRHQVDITGLIGQYAQGNEPSHHVAYLYNYIGKPWKTQARVHQIMNDLYQATPDGLSGNEDCGQMSAWYVLSAMGFYSVLPGSNHYAIGTPIFDKVTINLENGKQFVIRAQNRSQNNYYIQSAQLNRKAYNKSYLNHQTILAGGELLLDLGPTPNNKWAIATASRPPSHIADATIVPTPFFKSTGKTFKHAQVIELGTACQDCTIHYTLNDSLPTPQSPVYDSAFDYPNNDYSSPSF